MKVIEIGAGSKWEVNLGRAVLSGYYHCSLLNNLCVFLVKQGTADPDIGVEPVHNV